MMYPIPINCNISISYRALELLVSAISVRGDRFIVVAGGIQAHHDLLVLRGIHQLIKEALSRGPVFSLASSSDLLQLLTIALQHGLQVLILFFK
jgi:hypothetical protein